MKQKPTTDREKILRACRHKGQVPIEFVSAKGRWVLLSACPACIARALPGAKLPMDLARRAVD